MLPRFLPLAHSNQIISYPKSFGGKKKKEKKVSFQGDDDPQQRKERETFEILLPRGLAFYFFYFHKQCWPISCMATDSNNCSHTNSIAVDRLAQGVDINSFFNFHLKVIA